MTDLAFPKVTGRSVRQRKRDRDKQSEAFRDAIWERDGGKDRATGKPVWRSLEGSIHERGDVAHLKCRRVMPEWKTDVRRGLLLSAFSHILSDHRGGNLLKMTDPETGEPATDAGEKTPKPIRFTLFDRQGNVKWSRVG